MFFRLAPEATLSYFCGACRVVADRLMGDEVWFIEQVRAQDVAIPRVAALTANSPPRPAAMERIAVNPGRTA